MGSKDLANDGNGIKGYPIKKWHHDINKPIVYGIHTEKDSKKPSHYLDTLLKAKAIVPAPNTFNMSRDLSIK